MNLKNRVIFHIDVNCAFLSFESVYRLQHGESLDLRDVASVVGGDEKSRTGIVLAKSQLAKQCGVITGEPLVSARRKCKNLIVVPPRHDLYTKCSNAMFDIFKKYTPSVERFSIDECFLDFTGMNNIYNDFNNLAFEIKERIKRELGFTVSIGISSNKLLAKMASDMKKPDGITTLFTNEIREKMWPLAVEDLFMVGKTTAEKLHKMNIYTIGQLANYDISILQNKLKIHGTLIWQYANGIENSDVKNEDYIEMKGIGNSTTIPFDVVDKKTVYKVLLSLSETVGMRLRASGKCCNVVAVHIKESTFVNYSKQIKLHSPIDTTNDIYNTSIKLFDTMWRKNPIRLLGIQLSQLCSNDIVQINMFQDIKTEKNKALDRAIDDIRSKYGVNSVIRSTFLNSDIKPLTRGIDEEDSTSITTKKYL